MEFSSTNIMLSSCLNLHMSQRRSEWYTIRGYVFFIIHYMHRLNMNIWTPVFSSTQWLRPTTYNYLLYYMVETPHLLSSFRIFGSYTRAQFWSAKIDDISSQSLDCMHTVNELNNSVQFPQVSN
jgi:hypothetical protein